MKYLPPYTIFILPVIMMALSQIVKGVFHYIKGYRNIRTFFMNGGIPSSHTAFVTSLITVVGYVEGITSTAFAIALVLAVIIIQDAMSVRIHIGKNGKAINQILRSLKKDQKHQSAKNVPESVEITGHHLHEVLAGAILGIGGTVIALFILAGKL